MKSWKSWPYWLRGGILFPGMIAAILVVLYFFTSQFGGDDAGGAFLMIVLLEWVASPALAFPTVIFLGVESWIIISLIIHFLIGALLGWIVGGVKEGKIKISW